LTWASTTCRIGNSAGRQTPPLWSVTSLLDHVRMNEYKERRKEGRRKGRKKRRKEEKKEGRKEGRKEENRQKKERKKKERETKKKDRKKEKSKEEGREGRKKAKINEFSGTAILNKHPPHVPNTKLRYR